MNIVTFQSYPLHVQEEVQKMNSIFNSQEKRSYVANKARLNLTMIHDSYSEAYAHLLKSLNINSSIQDEFSQKLVAFYFHAQQNHFKGNSMLEDFINNDGTLPHFFTSYC